MTIDPNNSKHLIADEGKVLRRISTTEIYGKEVFLGKIKIGNVVMDDVPENFDEVEEIEEES